MKSVAIFAALTLAACGSNDGVGGPPPDGGAPMDGIGGGPCSVQIHVDNTMPRVGVDAAVRATASVLDVDGTIVYSWHADLDGVDAGFDMANADGSAISIPISDPGTLHVQLALANHPLCTGDDVFVGVLPTNLATASYRLHVTPPASSGVPATDQIVVVHSGTDTLQSIGLSTGVPFADGRVVDGSGSGVAAYVRMTPVGAPDSPVDAYASALGALPVLHVLGEQHSALIVPDDPTLAPELASWSPGSGSAFVVGGGTAVHGVVRDPSGAALAGAAVALTIDGTPSSVGTTTASGAFTLHATPVTGAAIAITVTPPTASGLPRLVATSSDISLSAAWTIAYAAGLATRDLSGVHVTRGGAAIASAHVDLVGAIANAGTIVAGATNLTAAGDVRIATSTDGAGALSGRAPAAPLSLVVTRSASDVAVAAIDLTTAAPAQLPTPAPAAITGTVSAVGGGALANVRIDATGSGTLAGVVVQAMTDQAGHFSIPLAAGGAYALRLYDPAGRAAPLTSAIASAATANLGALALPVAVHLTGTISVAGGTTGLGGAAIQLLCEGCTGAAATALIAETAADANGRFRLAVPDPSASP